MASAVLNQFRSLQNHFSAVLISFWSALISTLLRPHFQTPKTNAVSCLWKCRFQGLEMPFLAPKDAFFFQICVKFGKHLPSSRQSSEMPINKGLEEREV
jgi:hypothetical protein